MSWVGARLYGTEQTRLFRMLGWLANITADVPRLNRPHVLRTQVNINRVQLVRYIAQCVRCA